MPDPEPDGELGRRSGSASQQGIVVRDLYKSFGDHEVLRGIDLSVQFGEVVVVIGASGSGKSTLLRCLNRLETPTSGSVDIIGRRITDKGVRLPEVRRQIGMVFQQFNLFPHMTALENVAEGPVTVLGMNRVDATRRARALLEKVGVAQRADQLPRRLSGGQQQRVAIARALALEPKIMLFDEPTSALDPELRAEVLDTMRQLATEGMTMVIVTHEMGFAKRVADRTIFIDEGVIVEEGTPQHMLNDPQSPRLRKFLNLIFWGDES